MKIQKFLLMLMTVVGFGFSMNAVAGEGLFSRVYTVETVPAGHYEIEQMFRNRFERAYGTYSAVDARTEFEYGITDNFQAAFYLNTGYIHAKNAPDDDDPTGNGDTGTGFSRDRLFLQGLSMEFIYRVMNPVTDGIGLAFYIEPEIDFYDVHNGLRYDNTFETEYRVMIQKNFFDDQLILVYNLILETEFIRFQHQNDADGNHSWAGELDFNNEIGLTYRFAPKWYGGIEGRNHNEEGGFNTHEHSLFWAGPAIHYGGESTWGTLGILRQVYGAPTGIDHDTGEVIGHNNLFERSHEVWEITAKVGFPF